MAWSSEDLHDPDHPPLKGQRAPLPPYRGAARSHGGRSRPYSRFPQPDRPRRRTPLAVRSSPHRWVCRPLNATTDAGGLRRFVRRFATGDAISRTGHYARLHPPAEISHTVAHNVSYVAPDAITVVPRSRTPNAMRRLFPNQVGSSPYWGAGAGHVDGLR